MLSFFSCTSQEICSIWKCRMEWELTLVSLTGFCFWPSLIAYKFSFIIYCSTTLFFPNLEYIERVKIWMNTVHSINHFLPIDSRDKKNTQYKNDILSSERKFALVNFKAVLITHVNKNVEKFIDPLFKINFDFQAKM